MHHLTFKQLVSCGESRPGSPNHLLGPRSLGLSVTKKRHSHRIEGAELPRWFHQPAFAIYNGRTDPVEHVSQFNQRMAVHSRDEVLMCKVFPSSLGPMAIRWFDGLKPNSINSFKQLT